MDHKLGFAVLRRWFSSAELFAAPEASSIFSMLQNCVPAGGVRPLGRLVWLVACCGILSGCAGSRSWESPANPPSGSWSPAAQSSPIVNNALAMVGKPYRYGAKGPESFDCSGLVWYSFRRSGYDVPRTSADQYRVAQRISLSEARPGDLLFFGSRRKVSHVAIYMGNDEFVHAPSSGKWVSVANFDASWYQKNFVTAGRLRIN